MQHFLLILYFNFENLPSLIFLEFAQNPNPKRFYVVHFLANKIINYTREVLGFGENKRQKSKVLSLGLHKQ